MLYNYAYAYTINMVNINAAKKNLTFNILFTRKVIKLLAFFKKSGVICDYKILLTTEKRPVIRVFLSYYKNLPLNKNFKLLSRPSRTFYMSLKALRFVAKRVGSAVYIISTDKGLMSHDDAILAKRGGILIGFFFI
jgi:ribosomal protein S8